MRTKADVGPRPPISRETFLAVIGSNALETGMAALADDDVIVDGDAERLRHGDEASASGRRTDACGPE